MIVPIIILLLIVILIYISTYNLVVKIIKTEKELKKKAKSRGIHIPPNQARGIMFMKAMSIVVIVINTGIFLVLSYAFIEEWNKL